MNNLISKQINNIVQKIWFNDLLIVKMILIILLPLSLLYYFLFFIRKYSMKQKKFKSFIICVGNCTIGGEGKTSSILSLMKIIQEDKKNLKVAVLLKGYKGKIKIPTKVDPKIHDATNVGDEALIYARRINTYISYDRLRGIEYIIETEHPDIILLDDGMQDFRIKKDLTILVTNGRRGFGNGLLLPAGPLRQLPSEAISQSDFVIIIGNDEKKIAKKYEHLIPKELLINASIISESNNSNKRFIAFSGIGNNKQFIETLIQHNFDLEKVEFFPDHYFYSDKDIKKIKDYASDNRLSIITTEKDWLRLNSEQKININYLEISINFKNRNNLEKAIFYNV